MNLQVVRDNLGFALSSVTAAAGVIAGLTFDKTLGTMVTAAAAVATAVFGYLKARRAEKSAQKNARDIANISASAAIETNSKTVLVQTVTAERAKWRAEMRIVVSELVSLLRASAREEAPGWLQVDRLRTEARLRLNPAGRGPAPAGIDKHEIDRKLHADLDALHRAGPAGTTAHDSIADSLEEHIADLLKGEWDKSKDEAVTGKLKTD